MNSLSPTRLTDIGFTQKWNSIKESYEHAFAIMTDLYGKSDQERFATITDVLKAEYNVIYEKEDTAEDFIPPENSLFITRAAQTYDEKGNIPFGYKAALFITFSDDERRSELIRILQQAAFKIQSTDLQANKNHWGFYITSGCYNQEVNAKIESIKNIKIRTSYS